MNDKLAKRLRRAAGYRNATATPGGLVFASRNKRSENDCQMSCDPRSQKHMYRRLKKQVQSKFLKTGVRTNERTL